MTENLVPVLSAPATDTDQVAHQSVMRALLGRVQTADEYKARPMTLLAVRAIQRVPIAGNRIVPIDDDADPGILRETRAFLPERYRCGHLPALRHPNSVASILLDCLRGG